MWVSVEWMWRDADDGIQKQVSSTKIRVKKVNHFEYGDGWWNQYQIRNLHEFFKRK